MRNAPLWQYRLGLLLVLSATGLVAIMAAEQAGAPVSDAPITPRAPVNPLRKSPAGTEPKTATRPINALGPKQPAVPTTDAESPAAKTSAAKTPAAKSPAAPKPKFDPELVNGRYFEGWPKPKLALVVTGRQDGYLEPCGCSGLENQKGGMSRRLAFLKQLRAQGWPLACVDVGGLVHRFGRQAEIKFNISVEALKQMDYAAVGFGADDLRLSAGEIAAAVAGQNGKESLFVSANVGLFDLTPRVKIIKAGGLKVGITAVLGDKFQKQVNNAEVELTPAAAAIDKVLPQLKDCDLRILLANATLEESQQLAKQFPQFNFVVAGDGGDEPPNRPVKVEGTKTRLLEVGHKGMFAIVLGLYDDPKQPIRYQRVALDSRFPASPEMKQLMADYQAQLEALDWQGLGLRPARHPQADGHEPVWGQFAGAASCKRCHEAAYDVWSKSKHAHATDTLVKLDPPREHDAECISCHVTGWNPQEYFPYAGGYVNLKQTPQLAGNTCENCHGPGAAHVAAEEAPGKDVAARDELRRLMGQASEQTCITCHDHDNSPDFKFETYWPQIEH